MDELTRLMGDAPRVRLISALLRLEPVEFTAKQAAAEAGVRTPFYDRHVRRLADEGFLTSSKRGRATIYRVNPAHPDLRLLTYFDSALGLAHSPGLLDEQGQEELEMATRTRLGEELASYFRPSDATSIIVGLRADANADGSFGGAARFANFFNDPNAPPIRFTAEVGLAHAPSTGPKTAVLAFSRPPGSGGALMFLTVDDRGTSAEARRIDRNDLARNVPRIGEGS